MKHRTAWRVISLAVACLLLLGWLHARAMHWPLWHGEFCALANGVTDGCDTAPANGYAYLVYTLEYCIVVPLLAATISLFTSSATADHVKAAEGRIKDHTEAKLQEHLSDCGPTREEAP